MMADNVPAVQALGQCIFLPMLIIGGVAVPLASLPDWAQRLSSFFPGRYAVEAIQACVMGNGLLTARFSGRALILIGGAGLLASVMMFRWDAQQRFASMRARSWVAVALAAWVAVGLSAESKGRRARVAPEQASATAAAPPRQRQRSSRVPRQRLPTHPLRQRRRPHPRPRPFASRREPNRQRTSRRR